MFLIQNAYLKLRSEDVKVDIKIRLGSVIPYEKKKKDSDMLWPVVMTLEYVCWISK